MDADNSNKPAQTPGLKPLNPWKTVLSKSSIVKKLGGPLAQKINRKTLGGWGEKRETKLPNKTKKCESEASGEGSIDTAFGGVGSEPGALTRFNISSYKQALNVKITEISEKVSELIPLQLVQMTTHHSSGNGVMENKMTELSSSEDSLGLRAI
jgi:hypothetical protein